MAARHELACRQDRKDLTIAHQVSIRHPFECIVSISDRHHFYNGSYQALLNRRQTQESLETKSSGPIFQNDME